MKSQQILPIKNRLDNLQILELEGFLHKNRISYFNTSIFTKDELLLKYHKALIEAEKEVKELKEEILDDIIEMKYDLEETYKNVISKLQ